MLNNGASYKYKTPYKGQFLVTKSWNNGTVTLKCGSTKIKHNKRRMNPYTSDTNVEYINIEKYV